MHQKGQHLPDMPPYVVLSPRPTAGQGVLSAFSPISPDTVLVAVTPSAPPVKEKVTRFLWSRVHVKEREKNTKENLWNSETTRNSNKQLESKSNKLQGDAQKGPYDWSWANKFSPSFKTGCISWKSWKNCKGCKTSSGNAGADRQISALLLCGTEPATAVVQHLKVPQNSGHLLQASVQQDKRSNVTKKQLPWF